MPDPQVQVQADPAGAPNGAPPAIRPDPRAARQAARAESRKALEAGPTDLVVAKPADTVADVKPAPEVDPDAPLAEPDPDEPSAAAVDADDDPEVARRIAKVQKAEKRAKEGLRDRELELDRREAAHHERTEKFNAEAAKFSSLAKRVKSDPASVLLELGMTEDDFEHASKVLYLRSKAGAADPKNKAAAEHAIREREAADRLENLETKIEKREREDAERTSQAANERAATKYLDGVAKAVDDSAPLAQRLLAKNPDKARAMFAQITHAYIVENDEAPEASDVLAIFEEQRRAELEELGVDVTAYKTTPKKNNQTAEEKRPAKTLGTDLSTHTAARPATLSDKEHRRETVRKLEAGTLD
jgi:hypothetical protein